MTVPCAICLTNCESSCASAGYPNSPLSYQTCVNECYNYGCLPYCEGQGPGGPPCGTPSELQQCLQWNETHPYARLACEAMYGPCTSGRICCDGMCRDVSSDPTNCGICGNFCSGGSSCCSGACVDVSNSFSNCGSCGHQCLAGQACINGACQQICPAGQSACGSNCCTSGQTCCSGACVDLQTDLDNCGRCGRPCASGENCVEGYCECPGPICPNGQCCPAKTCCVSESTTGPPTGYHCIPQDRYPNGCPST
jgi:hypothetical protein